MTRNAFLGGLGRWFFVFLLFFHPPHSVGVEQDQEEPSKETPTSPETLTQETIEKIRRGVFQVVPSKDEKQGFAPFAPLLTTDRSLSQGFLPRTSPDSTAEIIDQFVRNRPDLFEVDYLQETSQTFFEATSRLYSQDRAEQRATLIFEQWLFLEIYKITRLEYLLVNFSKTIILLPGISYQKALSEFDVHLPHAYFQNYPRLRKLRGHFRDQIETSLRRSPEKIEAARGYLVGTLESAYVGLSALEQNRRFVQQQYAESDENYQKEISAIEEWRRNILNTSSLLSTKAFQTIFKVGSSSPDPEDAKKLIDQVRKARHITQRAMADFQVRVEQFQSEQQAVLDLVDFLTGSEVEKLGAAMTEAFALPEQVHLRNQIQDTLPEAVQEVFLNLKEVLHDWHLDFYLRDLKSGLINSNLHTANDNQEFHEWLYEIQTENALRWIILKEYPMLRDAADSIEGFMQREIRRKNRNRIVRYSALTLVTFFSPMTRSTSAWNQFFGSRSVELLTRFGFLAGEGYLTYTIVMDAVASYERWQYVSRMARLSLEGSSITDIWQEDLALRSFWWHATIASIASGAMTVRAGKEIARAFRKSRNNEGWIIGAVQSTWHNNPLSLKDIRINIKQELRNLARELRAFQLGKSVRSFNAICLDITTALAQFPILVPAALPDSAKSLLGSFAKSTYNAFTLGTMMSVLAVTTQHHINAFVVESIVYVYRRANKEPPVFLEQNALNWEERTTRTANLETHSTLEWRVNVISQSFFEIAMSKSRLKDANLDDENRHLLEMSIDLAERSIKMALFHVALYWYEKVEYRDLVLEAMLENGFGFIPFPSYDNPSRIQIYLQVDDKSVISINIPISEFEKPKLARRIGADEEQIDKMISRLVGEADLDIEDLNETQKDSSSTEKKTQEEKEND